MIGEHTKFKNKYAGTFNGSYNYTSGPGFGQLDYVYQNELHGFTDSQLNSSTDSGRLHITSLTLTNTSDHSYFVNCYAATSTSVINFTVYPGSIIFPNSTLQLCSPQTTKSFVVGDTFQYNFRFQVTSVAAGITESVWTPGDISYSINWVLETSL